MALHQYETGDTAVVARPAALGDFQTAIDVRGIRIVADEPVEVGGDGSGPTPYELLSAALAACTSMTLRMYARRKGWVLPPFSVSVTHAIVPDGGDGRPRDRFNRYVAFDDAIDPEQRLKLLEIADKCPVHRTLMRGFIIATDLGPPMPLPLGEPPIQHEHDAERACAEQG